MKNLNNMRTSNIARVYTKSKQLQHYVNNQIFQQFDNKKLQNTYGDMCWNNSPEQRNQCVPKCSTSPIEPPQKTNILVFVESKPSSIWTLLLVAMHRHEYSYVMCWNICNAGWLLLVFEKWPTVAYFIIYSKCTSSTTIL